MSLQDWLNNKWLKTHKTSSQEIRKLVEIARRDLQDASVQEISADSRLSMAYNAALRYATVALNICGYRTAGEGHHERTIDSLKHTIGADSDFIMKFQGFRKKRNVSSYDLAGTVSDQEVDEAIKLARELYSILKQWVEKNYPQFLSDI